jgi:inner membrane protein
VLLAVLPLAALTVSMALTLRSLAEAKDLSWGFWRAAALLAMLGGMVHIGADAMNSYGVHPFWPFSGAWIYGDSVFIVEPLLWTTLDCYVALRAQSRVARWLPAVLLAAVVAVGLSTALLPWPALLTMGLVGGLALGVGLALCRRHPWAHAVFTYALTGAVIASFFVRGAQAREQVRARLEGSGRLLDITSDPLPANLFCFSFLSIETAGEGENETALLRSGRVALFPSLVPLESCPRRQGEGVPLAPSSRPSDAQVAFDGEHVIALPAFRGRVATDCALAAWMRFTRMPYITASEVHDLRYARFQKEGFSTLHLNAGVAEQTCPRNVPGWTPPRADLLAPLKKGAF